MKIHFENDRLGKCEWELPPMLVERLNDVAPEDRSAVLVAIQDEVQGHLHLIAGALLSTRAVQALRAIGNNRRDLSRKLRQFIHFAH